MYPLLYIIIVNWNHKDDLIETIESLLKQDYQNFKILIVDNASTDDSISYVKRYYENIEIIENKDNMGWAEGNNIGIKHALNKNAYFVLLANNDIYIEDNSLITKMVQSFNFLSKEYKIGILGTSEGEYYFKKTIRSQGWIMYPKYEKYGLRFNKYRMKCYDIPKNFRVVDFVSGFFMLIKSNVFKEIGIFDNKFFMYAEETDFSLRAWSMGYQSLINIDLSVYHKGASSSGVNSPFQLYYQIRNNFYLLKQNKNNISLYQIYFIIYFYEFFKLPIALLLNRFQTKYSRIKILKYALLGLYHGITKKMSKTI
jgi:GT2 family glycosyltransferase